MRPLRGLAPYSARIGRSRAPLAALVAVVAAGCGGAGGGYYAGMDEGEVPLEAMSAVGREVRESSSPLYRHKLELGSVRRGRNSAGDEAWVVRFWDKTERAHLCVRVWARTALTVRSYNSEIDRCDLEGDPPPPAEGPERVDA